MGRRENCQRCDLKIPSNADLALGNWGVIGPLAGKATFVEVFSDKGADILNDVIEADLIAVEEPLEKGIAIRDKINNFMLSASAKKKKQITQVLLEISSKYSKNMKTNSLNV